MATESQGLAFEYKGWKVHVRSQHRDGERGWRTYATVTHHDDDLTVSTRLSFTDARTFPTKLKADEGGRQIACVWIDKQATQ